ncbi:MAG TPA: GAK system XXXCH domain-containing protein [Desulfonatronum sp.]|nr:GAK system XXXCH domain-containing protein [Desulfonatronum sp.]
MDFHNLKRHLNTFFSALQRSADAGELPQLSDAASFVLFAEKMHMNASDDWLPEAEDFLHLARQLHSAIKHKKIQDTVLLMDALQDAQEFCHRTYREKG